MHDKQALLRHWRAELGARAASLAEAQQSARAGTRVDGQHRPENRGERAAVTTQGYLAQGFQLRLEAIEEELRLLDEAGLGPRERVHVGALVCLEDAADGRHWILIAPGGDASMLPGDVRVLSVRSPWVRALYGLEVGDGGEVPRLGDVSIVAIR